MKRIALLLAAAGIASATAITFSQNGGTDTGLLDLLASQNVNKPSTGTVLPQGNLGAIGGMCTGLSSPGVTTQCSAVAGATPDILTFTLFNPAFLQIQLLDQFQVADVYDVILTGPNNFSATYTSSQVSYHGAAVQACYNANLVVPVSFVGETPTSSANSCLNATTGLLGAGSYSITVWDFLLSYGNGQSDPFGGTVAASDNLSPARFALELTQLPASVPEPATLGLLGLGGIALGLLRRGRK